MSTLRPFSEAELDRLAAAVHEAGHACAGVILGGRVHLATVDGQARTEYDTRPAGTEALTAFAGPWAEARFTLRRTPGPADVRRFLACNGSDDQVLCAAGGSHEGAPVVPLLERNWGAVKALTKQLYYNGTVSHQDVCAALGLTDEGGPGSLGLALIRSGGAPR